MSKIISHFSSVVCFILLLSLTTINQTQAMLPDDKDAAVDNLTLGQRLVKEAKNAPGYEPKNYGKNTRQHRRVAPAPQPQLTQQQLEAQRQAQQAAAAQRAQQLEAQRQAAEKAKQEKQEMDEFALKIKLFSECSQIPNDELWQGMPKFIQEAVPQDIFQIPFEFLSKDEKEELAKTYIRCEKPSSLNALLDKVAPPIVSPILQFQLLPLHVGVFKTAFQLCQNPFIITSVLNASGLAYRLEEDQPLRNDKISMLRHLNKDIKDGFWSGVDFFEVVTGNYERCLKNKPSGHLFSSWLKQPAVIASSNADGYPLIIVAFKGTTQKQDWLSNVKIFPKDLCNLGGVHAGFYDIANSCKKELAGKLSTICQRMNVQNTGVQVLFTGHNMGAAVAAISSINQLATLVIQSKKPLTQELNLRNNVVVINFGQPRIWKKVNVDNFKNVLGEYNYVRLVAADKYGKTDSVSGYRPNDMLEYAHFGREIIRNADKTITSRATELRDIHRFEHYQAAFEGGKEDRLKQEGDEEYLIRKETENTQYLSSILQKIDPSHSLGSYKDFRIAAKQSFKDQDSNALSEALQSNTNNLKFLLEKKKSREGLSAIKQEPEKQSPSISPIISGRCKYCDAKLEEGTDAFWTNATKKYGTVLSLDGGGIRGYMQALWIDHLEKKTNRRSFQLFDYISGTSIGGILSLALAFPDESRSKPALSTENLIQLFTKEGQRIFPQKPQRYQYNIFGRGFDFAKKCIYTQYDAGPLESLLKSKDYFADYNFKNLLTPVCITAVDSQTQEPIVLDSLDTSMHELKIWQVARATSAAPTYFNAYPMTINGKARTLIDGGLYRNNPAELGTTQILNRVRQTCQMPLLPDNLLMISLGTGQLPLKILPDNAGFAYAAEPTIEILMNICSTSIHQKIQSFLPSDNYLRINPKLDEDIPLDKASASNFETLKKAAELDYETIDQFIGESNFRHILEKSDARIF